MLWEPLVNSEMRYKGKVATIAMFLYYAWPSDLFFNNAKVNLSPACINSSKFQICGAYMNDVLLYLKMKR